MNDERWAVAIGAADNYGDFDPLVKLLRAGAPSDDVCELLADMLEHRKLSRAVRTSRKDMKLLDAAYCVKTFRRPDETDIQATKRFARECGVKEKRLRDVLGNRSKITQRLNRRS